MSKEPSRANSLLTTFAVAVLGGIAGGLVVHTNRPNPVEQASAPAAASSGDTTGVPAVSPTAPAEAHPVADGTELRTFPARRGARDPHAVIQALGGDDETQRLAALETALAYDVELTPELLLDTYQRPGSDALRLLAFERHIDSLASDVEAARTAMQSATASDSQAVRAEAYRRLEQLAAFEANAAEAARFPQSIQ